MKNFKPLFCMQHKQQIVKQKTRLAFTAALKFKNNLQATYVKRFFFASVIKKIYQILNYNLLPFFRPPFQITRLISVTGRKLNTHIRFHMLILVSKTGTIKNFWMRTNKKSYIN